MPLRKHPRFAAQFPVSFSGENISGEGTLSDISLGGCRVSSATSPASGSVMTLRIDLYGDDSPLVIDLAAVRWSAKEQFGVEFIQVGTAHLERLQALVKTLE